LLLIFGPTSDNRGTTIGGTTLLCDQMIQYITNNKIKDTIYIKTNKFDNKLFNLTSILLSLLIKISRSKVVVVNASDNLMLFFCPLAYMCAKIFRKKIIIRTFGANFDTFYNNLSSLNKLLIKKTVLRSDIIFSETNHQIASFYKKHIPVTTSIQWFPNCRRDPKMTKSNKMNKELKLMFLGAICQEKGVDDLIELNRRLDNKIVDFYGYTQDNKYLKDKNFNYKGPLDPKKVLETMSGYDFLVLPTTWHGEGYPGVIIEAFSIGLPVIATNFRAIPDLVKDNYNGFLVEQNNIDNLILIITALRDERAFYATMCSQSKITFKSSYDSDVLHKVFFETIEKLG